MWDIYKVFNNKGDVNEKKKGSKWNWLDYIRKYMLIKKIIFKF